MPDLPLNPTAPPDTAARHALALPPPGRAADALTPWQRRLLVAAIVAAHAAGAWGLMQVDAVREAVREAAPMFVDLIAPPAPPVPPAAPPAPQPLPKPIQKKPPPAPPIAAAPSPAPAEFVAPAAPPAPIAAPAEPLAIAAAPAPAAPGPVPPPMLIPASALQYLIAPAPEYPRLSTRNGEAGRVVVRVFIDAAGLPGALQVAASSGFARLDGAALAAVQKARFRPPTSNGRPISGWALVPIDFALEK